MKIIITGACAISARSVLRSLRISEKFRDAEFIGWDMATTLYGLYEGLFDRLYKVPVLTNPQYRTVVEKIIKDEKPDAVIVVPEVEVLYWAENPFDVPCFLPPVDFCRIAISKKRLFETLEGHNLVPNSIHVLKNDILRMDYQSPIDYPLWIRDSSLGTASGKGSFKARTLEELQAWAIINTDIDQFQLSQFLSGGNYGVFCLFEKGVLKKLAIVERLKYIMAKIAASGITGNTSKGRMLNDKTIRETALKAINVVCEKTNSVMNGMVVVDMKADDIGKPCVTEINIRHVSFSSSFAIAGLNLAEYHLLCALDRGSEMNEDIEMIYPKDNLILRDVDGQPIYVPDYKPLQIGEYIAKNKVV
jgi:carbamoyl-phosphate synthase large subunit